MEAPRLVIVGPWWRPLPPVRDGAPEWVIEQTVRRLQRLHPVMVSPWCPELAKAEYDRSRYRHIRPGPLSQLALRLPFALRKRWLGTNDPGGVPYVLGLGRLLRRLRPEIVVVHVMPLLCRAARRALPSARIIHYSHTSDLQEMPPQEWKRFIASIDGLVTVSQASLDAALERHGPVGIPARAIRNGVDLEALHPRNRERWRREARARLGLGEGPVAVFCGRLAPRKGADHLLHAFARIRRVLPSAQLLVVGASTHMAADADAHTQELYRLARECGTDGVRFSGYVPYPLLGNTLAAADVGVLPSVEQEGMPLSILEFAACGMPVAGSRVGGVGEVIRHDIEGFLVDPARMDRDLEPALLRLLADAALRERMGDAARSRVEAGFGWERVAREFEETVDEYRKCWSAAAAVNRKDQRPCAA